MTQLFEYMDAYRDPRQVEQYRRRIGDAAEQLQHPIRLMEVCGGHTMAIQRFGIPSLLPEHIELTSGPGCPVCVTPGDFIDAAIAWGREHEAIVTTFGDLYRVPGSDSTLEHHAAAGLDVRIVYSPSDALEIACSTPGRPVLFLAVGFETTAPTVAATLETAGAMPGVHFRVMSAHKTMPGALRALVSAPDVAIDGLLLPGHVSTIIGARPYRFLSEQFGIPCAITGFEPLDILRGILSIVEQHVRRAPTVDNTYGRAVRDEGNRKAMEALQRIFEPIDSYWRGLGCIAGSGLDLNERWQEYRVPPPDPYRTPPEETGCRCGEVLRGVLRPPECPLFDHRCTPATPVGPCMVSSEGACAAHHRYRIR